jgi:hypothetical protein
VRTRGGIKTGAFDRRRRGSGSVMTVRTDELGGVQCAGSRGAADDRPGQEASVSAVTPLWPPCGLVGLLN